MAENEQPQPSPSDEEPQAPAEQPPQAESQDAPKIIADDDWKAQAQAEKQELAEKIETAGAEGEAEGKGGAAPGEGKERQLPPASFPTLVSSLVTQTFMALGGMQDPQTGKRYVDLDLAKYHIDTLVVIEQKTEGNLTDEEKKLLDQGLYECRMQYVNIAQRVSGTP